MKTLIRLIAILTVLLISCAQSPIITPEKSLSKDCIQSEWGDYSYQSHIDPQRKCTGRIQKVPAKSPLLCFWCIKGRLLDTRICMVEVPICTFLTWIQSAITVRN